MAKNKIKKLAESKNGFIGNPKKNIYSRNILIEFITVYLELLNKIFNKEKHNVVTDIYFVQDGSILDKLFYKRFDKYDNDIDYLRELFVYLKDAFSNFYLEDNNYYWFDLVELYCLFIRYSEKVISYKNDISTGSLVVIDEKENRYGLVIDSNDYELKMNIEHSLIKNPDGGSILQQLIDAGKSYQTFYKITYLRKFGSQMKNTFNIIKNEEIQFDDNSDELLLRELKYLISKYMYNEFCNIIENITSKYTIDYTFANIDWRDILNDGFWIRR